MIPRPVDAGMPTALFAGLRLGPAGLILLAAGVVLLVLGTARGEWAVFADGSVRLLPGLGALLFPSET